MRIVIKRIYEEPVPSDGARILVDRLWPRGVSKERAKLDLWLKDIAPSTGLREWFGHDPKKWIGFQKKYKIELANNEEAVAALKKIVRQNKTVTLLYAAKDEEHNEAVVINNLLSGK
jgi:uncharacterized protein YeaO (DUF488 family)